MSAKLSSLCDSYDPDVLILAESKIEDSALLRTLNNGKERVFFNGLNISKRIKFYSKYPADRFLPILDDNYFSVRQVIPYLGPPILLVAVHLPSKLHAEPTDQMIEAQYLAKTIRSTESERIIFNTVAIGDFNMSPFEDGMVAANGMHAVLDRNIARKRDRIVKGRKYSFFYNPMWGMLGDLTQGPPGTHKYSKAVDVNHFWHTFDQLLIRPDLIKYFSPENIEVIEENGSDHFPLFLNLTTETPL
nr:endonuclease/exonuclease/phosphatase family protein [Rugamonas rubra]